MKADQEPVDPNKPEWLSYEELTTYLLNRMRKEFGFERVEGKQDMLGKESGTIWEIDGKGILEGEDRFFIVQCKCYSSALEQGLVGQLANTILDTRADGAILVSPMGLQKGAALVAAAKNILSVQLFN